MSVIVRGMFSLAPDRPVEALEDQGGWANRDVAEILHLGGSAPRGGSLAGLFKT